jgi:hypothetical protein
MAAPNCIGAGADHRYSEILSQLESLSASQAAEPRCFPCGAAIFPLPELDPLTYALPLNARAGEVHEKD